MTDSTVEFLSPVSVAVVAIAAAIVLAAYAVARLSAGPPAAIARRWGLYTLRGLILAAVAAMLVNPVRVDRSPGPLQQPEVFCLLDASESMAMGSPRTRWQHALKTLSDIEAPFDGAVRPQIQTFRFGSRLTAAGAGWRSGEPASRGRKPAGGDPEADASGSPGLPTEKDTRLATALRQLTSRFGHKPPASVVLLSDGRVRDADGARKAAEHYRALGVPIHAVPLGRMSTGGDVAIVSVVAPQRVRRYTQVELQVFLRSFGYDGTRTSLELWADDEDGNSPRRLQSLPITLTSGVQSRTLAFRSDLSARRLQVRVRPQPDELSTANNELVTEVAVDRTKIRVLYVEGNSRQVYRVRRGQQWVYRGPYSDLQEALTRDEDIECVVVTRAGLAGLQRLSTSGGTVRGFPSSMAELFAFDAIILSDVPPQLFTDEQLQWIEKWIERRGGGLCMVGGRSSFAAGGWDDSPLAALLPVELEAQSDDWHASGNVTLSPEPDRLDHPIWHILQDAARNRQIVQSMPAFGGANHFAAAKPNLSTVLARSEVATGGVLSRFIGTRADPVPTFVVGRYGKGRTMALAVPITVPWANEFVNQWGAGDNRYYGKFWRNVVYWLTEDSFVGRRRLVASTDKTFYRPGETLRLGSLAYDEGANRTTDYRIVAMIEPQDLLSDLESEYAPIRWPQSLPRDPDFGGQGPYVAWGEEFELPRLDDGKSADDFGIELEIADAERFSSGSESLRIELTAYEGYTQVDSTSMQVQILHDPFEQQNPFPDHELLQEVAAASGGRVLEHAGAIANSLEDLPVHQGKPTLSKVPMWSRGWLLAALLVLLTSEWLWRRSLGLA